jgi:hypothetical protein
MQALPQRMAKAKVAFASANIHVQKVVKKLSCGKSDRGTRGRAGEIHWLLNLLGQACQCLNTPHFPSRSSFDSLGLLGLLRNAPPSSSRPSSVVEATEVKPFKTLTSRLGGQARRTPSRRSCWAWQILADMLDPWSTTGTVVSVALDAPLQ